ncbi:MAG: uncharacterized protein PWP31_984 [Clostridia bacterium]|nr:uncharacterized protein [Clostridia bacterium]
MIKATFWQALDGSYKGFSIKGHAGYAPKGQDIVCAAVSALAQTAYLSLKKQLKKEPQLINKDGYYECNLPLGLSHDEEEKAAIILKTIKTGLKAIATDYSDFIEVKSIVKRM